MGGLGTEVPLVVGPPVLLSLSQLSIVPLPVSATSLLISALVALAATRKSRVAVLTVAQRFLAVTLRISRSCSLMCLWESLICLCRVSDSWSMAAVLVPCPDVST